MRCCPQRTRMYDKTEKYDSSRSTDDSVSDDSSASHNATQNAEDIVDTLPETSAMSGN